MEEFRICTVEVQAATEDLREEISEVISNLNSRHCTVRNFYLFFMMKHSKNNDSIQFEYSNADDMQIGANMLKVLISY